MLNNVMNVKLYLVKLIKFINHMTKVLKSLHFNLYNAFQKITNKYNVLLNQITKII